VSALLLVEVIDTAGTLLDAILWWILVAGFVATVVVYTAVLTGAWAWRAVRRGVTGPLADEQAPEDPEPLTAPQGHTGPSWAHTEHEHQEAA
jgi:hypothetical protein